MHHCDTTTCPGPACRAGYTDAELNRLHTGSLTVQDIEDRSSYSASQVSVSGGSAWTGSGSGARSLGSSLNPGLAVPQKDTQSGTTRSGIAAGSIEIADGDERALAGLNRDVTHLQASGVENRFNLQRLQENLKARQIAGQVGMRAVGDIAKSFTRDYEEAKLAKELAQLVLNNEAASTCPISAKKTSCRVRLRLPAPSASPN